MDGRIFKQGFGLLESAGDRKTKCQTSQENQMSRKVARCRYCPKNFRWVMMRRTLRFIGRVLLLFVFEASLIRAIDIDAGSLAWSVFLGLIGACLIIIVVCSRNREFECAEGEYCFRWW